MTLRRAAESGQSMVEFAFALVVLLTLLMGIVDLGRAVYTLTGTAEAATEIARVTSVHPGSSLGTSPETTHVVIVQTRLVPGLAVTSYECVDIAGAPIAGSCKPGYGYWVRVTVASTFHPITPLAMMLGAIQMTSHSSAKIE
jgi:Flp pilus assembly protein TadG